MSVFKNRECVIEDKKYRICDELGTGGNGCVWSIQDLSDGQIFAIKFLNSDSKEKVERFRREILFCRQNSHKNIVKVLAQGVFNNKECYIMPKYERTLRDIMKQEINLIDLFGYIKQLCEAIKFAHDNSVIHRDIKPENIFVDMDENLVLADFGIAHFIDSTITETREWLGNKSYAAPEQLIKESIYEITTASDIFALGKIINELFTGENANGTKFMTILDKYPILYRLDRLVHRCLVQNPLERPNIDEIMVEIQLIEGQLRESFDEIEKCLLLDETIEYQEEFLQRVLPTACEDILIAKYYFEHASKDIIENLNPNYHRNIRYKIDKSLKNLCLQKEIMGLCESQFLSEACRLAQGNDYVSLNIENEEGRKIYQEFKEILLNNSVENDFIDIVGINLKLFSSCCDYHCMELLDGIKNLIKNYETFDDAPIIYLVCRLKNVLSHEECEKIEIIEHISIDYENISVVSKEENNIFLESKCEEEKILLEMKKKWKIIIGKNNAKYYSVIFETKDRYMEFKEYALSLAKGKFVFEGDVLDMLRVNRKYAGIVEIGPLNSFDITSTLAKVLGLRNDY